MADYQEEIDRYKAVIKRFRGKPSLYNTHDEDIYQAENRRYNLIYLQIHTVLAPQKLPASELKIKKLIDSIKEIDLYICKSKAEKFLLNSTIYRNRKNYEKLAVCYDWYKKWNELYENYYALISFRDIEYFAKFIEFDKTPQDKMWEYSIDTFNDNGYSGCTKGFFYYANKMIFEDEIEFILKQMPTAYGKSYSDSTMISFILGVDKNEQIVKVTGNKSLPAKCTKQVVDIMCGKRFLQVFPEYAKMYDGVGEVKDKIFSICRISDGLLTINGSIRDTNYECFSKEVRRDGIRGGYLFLDDIVQAKEILNIKAHKEDIDTFDSSWKKRCRDEYHFKIVCGGTTYDAYDFLCTLKLRYSQNYFVDSPINKWTKLNQKGNAVFVCVPKLDENDKLTFPQKCKLENVLQDRKNNPDVFMAMDMQKPIVPKGFSFYWDNLLQYDYIPSDCSDYAVACLDPARTGKNFVSMPICRYRQELLDNNEKIDRYYLVDAFYKKVPMDEAYYPICENIVKYHIVKLHIEKNTDTSLKFLLEKLLNEMGVTFCEITEIYSTKNKESRIYADESMIKKNIVYPRQGMYSPDSDMGKFMEHIVSYKYQGSEYDDSIDSIGMLCDKFVAKKYTNSRPKIIQL